MQLPMLPAPRPVDPHWKCQSSGECCTIPKEVVMTREERAFLLPRIPDGIRTEWRDIDEHFVALKAGPCPLFVFQTCLVYAHRPYNCRRFGCMRPDPKTEPYEQDAQGRCVNLFARLANSRAALRLAKRMQSKAQRWAVRFGWQTTS